MNLCLSNSLLVMLETEEHVPTLYCCYPYIQIYRPMHFLIFFADVGGLTDKDGKIISQTPFFLLLLWGLEINISYTISVRQMFLICM